MALPIAKLAPTGVVAFVVTYCCWPHLVAGPTIKVEAGKLPAIAATLLTPAITGPAARDPFQSPAPAPKLAADEHPPRTVAQSDKVTGREHDEPAAELSERWVLNATLLRGERRLAVINGKMYATGECLAVPGSPDEPYVVTQINADQVVIRGPGHTVDLRYNDFGVVIPSGPNQSTTAVPARNVPHTATKRASSNPAPTKPAAKSSEKSKR